MEPVNPLSAFAFFLIIAVGIGISIFLYGVSGTAVRDGAGVAELLAAMRLAEAGAARRPALPAGAPKPPPDATVTQYMSVMDWLGLDRCVVVQPNAYGDDNTCTMDAVASIGRDRARGRAVDSRQEEAGPGYARDPRRSITTIRSAAASIGSGSKPRCMGSSMGVVGTERFAIGLADAVQSSVSCGVRFPIYPTEFIGPT